MNKLGSGSYLNDQFLKLIPKEDIKIIFELGSRDALDAIDLCNYFKPDELHSFECNPDSFSDCLKNIGIHQNENILNKMNICNKAVSDKEEESPFYATDMERSSDKNIGASSMLIHRDNVKDFFQKKLLIRTVRLDNYMAKHHVTHIDLLCMDLQGWEKKALIGLGNRLKDVKYIISEVSDTPHYHGEVLFPELNAFMFTNGFQVLKRVGDDVLFKNTR